MKSTAIVFAIAAASLGFSAISSAQGNGRHGRREEPVRVKQNDRRHADQRDQMRRSDRNGNYSARGRTTAPST